MTPNAAIGTALTLWAGLLQVAVSVNAAPPADTPPKPEIRGTVAEPGSLRPVSDAAVLLFAQPAAGVRLSADMFSDASAIQTARTDATGAFRFALDQFGAFRVQARKEGYVEGGPVLRGPTSTLDLNISRDHPSREIRLIIGRPSDVAGLVEDEETRKPIGGLDIFAFSVFYLREQRRRLPQGHAVTGSDGRFLIKGMRPGDVMVGIRLKPWGPERIMKDFVDADAARVDEGYEETFWPGGADLASAYPLALGSGDSIDLGSLRVRRTRLHRVRVSAPGLECGPGIAARVALADMRVGLYETVAEVPCDRGFLVRGLAPGAYRIQIEEHGRPDDVRLRGVLAFELGEKNLEISVPMIRGVDVEGLILPADGSSRPDLSRVEVRMPTSATMVRTHDLRLYRPDAEGRFRVINTLVEEKEVQVTGLPEGFYTKELRYNGAKCSRQTVTLNAGALTHRLEIVVGDKSATINGSVVRRDRPFGGPFVVIVPWPLASPSALWPVVSTTGDEDGKFGFTGLAPGEYRVLAISQAEKGRIDEPNLLARLLPNAKKVVLMAGAAHNETLELTELR